MQQLRIQNGASDAPASQVRASAVLLLQNTGN
jgi:hypothetical protein